MKPRTMPEGADWQTWPVLEVLQAESGLSLAKLRARLAKVPCYRCSDKSVRYEPAVAWAAVNGDDDDDQEDDDTDAELIDGETISSKNGVFQLLAMLFREQVKMNAETRRERQETVKVMQEPLELGIRLIEQASKTQAARLEHLEGLWDRMVTATESMMAAQHARELERTKTADSAAMRKHALGLLDKHGPMLMSKWTLTREAQLALQFLGSLDPMVITGVQQSGVLDPEQVALLEQLKASLSKRRAAAAAAAAGGPKPGPANEASDTPAGA